MDISETDALFAMKQGYSRVELGLLGAFPCQNCNKVV
jgi:hypothetical protein